MQSRHAADQADDRTEATTRAPSPWNDASEKKLRDLWAEGVSLSGIALAIGGINRNQVVGKVHRLKLPSRPSPLSADARSWYRTANGRAVNVQGFEAYKAARNNVVVQPDGSAERAEADRLRVEAERAEADRLRVEAERAEADRLRVEAERAEADRLRVEAERAEADRLRVEAERAEADRIRVEAERAEADRIRVEAERAEADRLRVEAERAEADRIRVEAERAEADRIRVEALFPQAPLQGANLAVQSLRKEQCRWPFGDPRNADFCFCSGRARLGDVYCEDHAKLAYVPALPRRARAA